MAAQLALNHLGPEHSREVTARLDEIERALPAMGLGSPSELAALVALARRGLLYDEDNVQALRWMLKADEQYQRAETALTLVASLRTELDRRCSCDPL